MEISFFELCKVKFIPQYTDASVISSDGIVRMPAQGWPSESRWKVLECLIAIRPSYQ